MADPLLQTIALASLQNEIGLFVREEHAAQRDVLRRIWSMPVSERVADGRCIDRVSVVAATEHHTWRLRCSGNDARFRDGDHVRISRGDPTEAICEALMVSAGDTEIEVKGWNGETTSPGLQPGLADLCIDQSAVDLEKMYVDALIELGESAVGRERILPLLLGTLKPEIDPQEFDAACDEAVGNGFDDRQAEAIANACATDLCWLVHGPPGTGKTRVLANIAARLLRQGERVLVTSFTHRAINHALETIASTVGDRRVIARIAPYLDPMLSVQQYERFSDSPLARLEGGYVVGATPFALRSRRLRGVDFDTVIVDEASQVTLPLAVMAMLSGKRFIFAGDQHQLPPVTLTVPQCDAVKMSIFGRLVGRGFDSLLPVTRRLNDQLCRWPSDAFYQSRLVPHVTAASRRLQIVNRAAGGFEIALAAESSVVWMAVPHSGARTAALEEVTLVADLLLALQRGGVAWRDIGVVVPFRRQARLLRRHLTQNQPDQCPIFELVVDTVERMQGQEREVVIMSFATSDAEFAMRLREFLFQPQRLNVAATRPRSKLIIVASPALLTVAQSLPDDPGAGHFVDLLRSASRVDVSLPAATDESET